MSEKRYYWLKLPKDFFKRHDVRIIEAMPNGKDYILFYLKLLCESIDHEGNLRFSDQIPYNEEMLKDRKAICRNMLTNPFEKFERKRFLYYSKDLSVISMNHALFSQMETEDWDRVRRQLQEDLKNYYSEMGGI